MEALRALLTEATDADARAELLRALAQPSGAEALAGLAGDTPCLQVCECLIWLRAETALARG
jgi:hypothetical protein